MARGSGKASDLHPFFPRWSRVRGYLRGIVVLVAGLGFGGCASVPNVAPFVEATSQYRSAVVAGGSAVDAELRAIGTKEKAAEFAKEWAVRIQATDALVSYSALDRIRRRLRHARGAGGAERRRFAHGARDGGRGYRFRRRARSAWRPMPPPSSTDRSPAVRASLRSPKRSSNATPVIDRIATTWRLDLDDAQTIFDAANRLAQDGA